MVRIEDDNRPFVDIWNDYFKSMAHTAWYELNDVPLNLDVTAFNNMTAAGWSGVWPIMDDDTRVGYILWIVNEDLFTSEFVFTLASIYISQEYRSKIRLKTVFRLLKKKIKDTFDVKRFVVMSNKYKTWGDRIFIGEV